MINSFPRQDIPESKKVGPSWYKPHLDYAESLIKGEYLSGLRTKIDKLYDGYNGIAKPASLAWLERTYGKQNRSKFTHYRKGRTKISLLHGEFLKMPLSATVTTINVEAQTDKMRQLDLLTGAMLAKQDIQQIQSKTGIDIMEGVPIPESEDDPLWDKLSPKDKQEDIMQIILDEQVKEHDIKMKFGNAFLQVLITAGCYMSVGLNQEGELEVEDIDLRDAIFEEIEGDTYLQRSPIRGCRRRLPIHEILLRYSDQLTKEQRDQLDQIRKSPDDYIKQSGGRIYRENGELLCDVVHIEWDSVTARYWKETPKTKIVSMFSDPGKAEIELPMDASYYENNPDLHEKNIKAGKYTVSTTYHTEIYEATRIGGIIDVKCQKRPFQHRSADEPSQVLNQTYFGFLCGTVDGIRVSLQQVVQNFDNMYDIVMFQANKDIARAKGKVMFYDRAGLPEEKSMRDVMYRMLNDQIVDWNSAASGNYAQKNLDITQSLKEIDLGLSNSFEYLMRMKDSISNDLDQITGINENRQGEIAASSTATNANSAINASRTITEPIYFGFNGFIEKVMLGIVHSSAVSWAFYKTEKGEYILGSKKHRWLQKVTKDIGYRDYGVHVENGSKYMEKMQLMNRAMDISLNAKEIRPVDYFKVNMAETLAQAKGTLENSWVEMQKAVQQSNEAQNQVKAQIEQARLQQQVQLSREDREDTQMASLDQIDRKGQWDLAKVQKQGQNKMAETQQKAQIDNILNQ